MKYRDSASYGKRQEFQAIAKLLELGLDVYSTLVDDQGIDCIIRLNSTTYLDIQIKARSKNANSKQQGYFTHLQMKHPRDNYFFILYSETVDSYWVFPSLELKRLEKVKGNGINKLSNGNYSARLTQKNKKTKQNEPKPIFDNYLNDDGFKLIEEAGQKKK